MTKTTKQKECADEIIAELVKIFGDVGEYTIEYPRYSGLNITTDSCWSSADLPVVLDIVKNHDLKFLMMDHATVNIYGEEY